jgi:CHAT domain-containing protein
MGSPCESHRPSRKYEKYGCATAQIIRIAQALIATMLLLGCLRRGDPQSAFNHALVDLWEGDIDAARRESENGYQDYRKVSVDWAWKFTILRAKVLHWEGRNDEALALLASEPFPPASGDLAVGRLRVAAVSYAALHKFSEAERNLAEAEHLCAISESPACAEVAGTRGKTEMERGHFNQAEALFHRALTSAQTNKDKFLEANAFLDLSWSANEQNHLEEALDWADSAREISVTHHFADVAQAALGNTAWAYYKLGDPDKAENLFKEAQEQTKRLNDKTDQLRWLTAAAYIQMDANNVDLAKQSFDQSLALAKQINSREDIINSLIALAFVSEQTGKLGDAKGYADQALTMARADGNGRDIVYPLLVEGRVAAHEHDATTAEANFREVAKSPDTPVFLKWEAERSLARLYEDENQFDSADAEYQTALTTFEEARCGLHERVDSRLPFLSNAVRIYEDYAHLLVARGKTLEALQVADYARARTLAEGLGRACKPAFAPDPLNATEIARRAGGTILFYALGQDHSYLWIVTQNRVRWFPLSANQSEIDTAIQRYRKKLEGPPDILAASSDASVLYQMLIAPAESFLKGALAKNKTIFIIPDAGLNSLNFETLMPRPGHYWIEDVTIANAPSLRFLPQSGSSRNLTGKLLLIGNPIVQIEQSGNAYPELPNAAAQMQNTQKYFSPSQQQIFARDRASPAAYLSNHPEQFSYIHFVAHGTASRTSPLDSAIILSANPASTSATQDNSFKLYARDIIGTPHLHAELVTISACYSTGNRTYSGEGLVGLSWAFLRAGAHNVIAALWDVSDASSPELVDKFYGELKQGKSPREALRTAKLFLLHGKEFHSPFYWGPFQLYTGS